MVVPIVTFGCFLSLYSSFGCKFVDVDIGFQPTNEGFSASEPYYFGPLFYHNESVVHDSMYRESLHTGCVAYPDNFYESFLKGDRTFKMIRVMTLISCVSSTLAMFVSWIFVISPIPAGILWPAILLPSVMIAFISEGSKFLMFDTALCRSAMWYEGSLLVPQQAEACSMGDTAWFACAAGVLHFWALVCVCLRAPERRSAQISAEPLEAIKEEESTSDDPDMKKGDDSSESFLKMEDGEETNSLSKGNSLLGHDIKKNDTAAISVISNPFVAHSASAISSPDQCMPLEFLDDGEMDLKKHGSLVTEGITVASATRGLGPSLLDKESVRPMSPVDCIIEGFDVATDLSQIDVCRTMVYSPTQPTKSLEIEDEPKQQEGSTSNAGQDDTVTTHGSLLPDLPIAGTQSLTQRSPSVQDHPLLNSIVAETTDGEEDTSTVER